MADYSNSPSVNPYWYYDPTNYQSPMAQHYHQNYSVSTPLQPSYDGFTQSNTFVDSGYLSRTPTPPTPAQQHSPIPTIVHKDIERQTEIESGMQEKATSDTKPRLPYVKRTRIQYTMQQLQILEEAFQANHYPEVTTVDALAELLDVRHEKISIWFQNRRSRFKRQQKPKTSASSSTAAINQTPATITKKATPSIPASAISQSPAFDQPTAQSSPYYPGYFWPSPIVDNRSSMSYVNAGHNSSFYEGAYGHMPSASMWNQSGVSYGNISSWHHSPNNTLNLSTASSSSSLATASNEHHV